MRFSKVTLPLTTQQTERATRLYRPDYDTLTQQERQLMLIACRDWQRCIQDAAGATDYAAPTDGKSCKTCKHGPHMGATPAICKLCSFANYDPADGAENRWEAKE
jgi:hypothetical protein